MDETKKDKLKEKTEDLIVEIKDYYREKEIYNFMNAIIDVHIKKILLDLNNYIENGDWKNCILLINKLTIQKIFKYAKEEYKIKFLDILIKKLLPNIYIYLEYDLDGVFEIIYYTLKYITNYKIDWKFFYTLFNVTHSSKSMVDFKSKLFISLHKYYSEDEITLDDYKIMKRSFFDDILMSRQTNAFCNFIYFFPKKYILEDDELQLRLLYLMQNRKINFIDCCVMFHKILRKSGKFCFSKDEQKNKEYIDTFIRYYFTLLNLFISGDAKVVKMNYESPIPLFNKEHVKKVRFEKSVVSVLIELLFNPNLKDIYSTVELHFALVLNNKHLFLKEKSKDAVTKNYIGFLQSFIYGINRLFHDKVYNKEIGKYILIPKKFEENEFLFNRLLIILKYLSLNLEKLFLFDNEGSCFSQRTLFLFLNEVKFNNDFMKKIIENINIEAYIKMLGFFKEYMRLTSSLKALSGKYGSAARNISLHLYCLISVAVSFPLMPERNERACRSKCTSMKSHTGSVISGRYLFRSAASRYLQASNTVISCTSIPTSSGSRSVSRKAAEKYDTSSCSFTENTAVTQSPPGPYPVIKQNFEEDPRASYSFSLHLKIELSSLLRENDSSCRNLLSAAGFSCFSSARSHVNVIL